MTKPYYDSQMWEVNGLLQDGLVLLLQYHINNNVITWLF